MISLFSHTYSKLLILIHAVKQPMSSMYIHSSAQLVVIFPCTFPKTLLWVRSISWICCLFYMFRKLKVKFFDNLCLLARMYVAMYAELMIMASHQTFSGQLWHLTDQIKFDWTNSLYIVNEEVNKFTRGKQMSRQISTLIISTVYVCMYVYIIIK